MPPRILEIDVVDKSLRDFVFACRFVGDDAVGELDMALERVGAIVQHGAAGRTLAHGEARTAAGFRSFPTSGEVVVSQVFPKTTGEHGEWGAWQMRHALIPAIWDNVPLIVGEFEAATDRVTAGFR